MKKILLILPLIVLLKVNAQNSAIYKDSTYSKTICCDSLHRELFPNSLKELGLKVDTNKKWIFLLKYLDFSKGRWIVYITFNKKDLPALRSQTKTGSISSCLFLSDTVIMNKMKGEWKIKNMYEGDICTPDLTISFLQDGVVKFCSDMIITDKYEGFQNDLFGWNPVKKNMISKYLRYFQPLGN